jgi:drug/metabolite transporter (DMT)-like permease
VDAVLLGVLAGALFGAMTVAVRWGLVRGGDPVVGAATVITIAYTAGALLALPTIADETDSGDLLRFFAIGALVPGVSQIVFTYAVRAAGPSRAAILFGTAPLLSVLLALALLEEPFEPALIVATALVVAGGGVLAAERRRPVDFRVVGVAFALACAVLFALRDNAVRWVARDADVPALQASAASLLAAALVTVAFAVATRRSELQRALRVALPSFAPAGLLFGLAYAALVTAFDRGRVGIVAPLNATQSLWGILFAALFFHRSEAIGRRTVVAGLLVVAGGAIVGVVR